MSHSPTELAFTGAANHQAMFAASARAMGGSVWHRHGGPVALTPGVDVLVGFPDVPAEAQSEFADEVVGFAREHRPLGQVGWWSMDDAGAGRLGARLLARGFQWGWRPTWMALDADELIDDHPVPADLTIAEIGPGEQDGLQDLPYRPPAGAASEPSLAYWAAYSGAAGVGVITLHCSEFAGAPVGGIYATSVLETARRQGIGTALTVAACRRARELGCRHVVLNATPLGQPVYRRSGFRLLGEVGQTWWMTERTLRAPAPDPARVELVEAIGDGDLATAERALAAADVDLETPLECGLTVREIATVTGRPDIAEGLAEPTGR